ncbi:MAG TPA: hypothetical protein VIH53_10460 [Gemmatimonadaceae bacterium]
MMSLLRRAASTPQYSRQRWGECMTDDVEDKSGGWVGLVLRDAQFWVPVVVLVAGLLVLRWIS